MQTGRITFRRKTALRKDIVTQYKQNTANVHPIDQSFLTNIHIDQPGIQTGAYIKILKNSIVIVVVLRHIYHGKDRYPQKGKKHSEHRE